MVGFRFPILLRAVVSFAVVCPVFPAAAQTKSQSVYVSAADQEISIKTIALNPLTDNVDSIYARPLTEFLRERLESDPQWSLVPFSATALSSGKADAVLEGRVTRGPRGMSITLNLNVGRRGLPLVIEESGDIERNDIESLKGTLTTMLEKMRDKMPYRGILLSRRGQDVTLNLGRNSGLRDGDTVSVIQVLRVNRHPKKQFMVGAEREILGKVKIKKADEELSFGSVIYEKEAGLLAADMKVLPDSMIAYNAPTVPEVEKPVEWLPEPDPQYGRVQVLAGIGQYSQSASFSVAGGITGANPTTPNLGVTAEGWIDADWFVGFDLRQSAFSMTNEYPNATPGKLNVSLSKYMVSGGRNFLLGSDFFGPKMQVSLGFGKFSARVDESNPAVFSNMEYGGMHFGFLFNTPVDPGLPWDLGARMRYHWSPGVTEATSSGSTKSVSAIDFSFLVARRVRKNFRYVGELNLENYNSDFSGNGDRNTDPVSSISHRLTTVLVGLEYAF